MYIAQITCILYYVLLTFGIQSCKARVLLKLGVFSDSNILKNCPVYLVNPKVRVRLITLCGN